MFETGQIQAGRLSAAEQASAQISLNLVDTDPLLGHRVPLADGHGVVLQGVEVDGDAERGADLVLTPVPPPDRPGVVEVDVPDACGGRRPRSRATGAEVGVA